VPSDDDSPPPSVVLVLPSPSAELVDSGAVAPLVSTVPSVVVPALGSVALVSDPLSLSALADMLALESAVSEDGPSSSSASLPPLSPNSESFAPLSSPQPSRTQDRAAQHLAARIQLTATMASVIVAD